MVQTINKYDFRLAFLSTDRADNFSLIGLDALFEYLEQLEEDTGEQIELDVIGLCCEYTEYESLEQYNRDYGTEYESTEELRYNVGMFIEIPGTDSFIVSNE